MIRVIVGTVLATVFVIGLGMIALAAGGSRSLNSYLVLASLLFAIGTFGFLARRNAISMLMSIELMLNAVNLSIVAFGVVRARRCGAERLGHRADRHGRRRRRGDRRPGDRHRDLPQQEDAARRRVRRDAAVTGR